jgi:hypothetical protein
LFDLNTILILILILGSLDLRLFASSLFRLFSNLEDTPAPMDWEITT